MPDVCVLDSFMHYEQDGAGPACVFLHGNPGSSRLRRRVILRVDAGSRP
jgi:haloalkane dehalogenase